MRMLIPILIGTAFTLGILQAHPPNWRRTSLRHLSDKLTAMSENPRRIHSSTKSHATVDSNLTIAGRWSWGECFSVSQDSPYVVIGNGTLLQFLLWNPRTSSPTIVSEYNVEAPVTAIRIQD